MKLEQEINGNHDLMYKKNTLRGREFSNAMKLVRIPYPSTTFKTKKETQSAFASS